VVVWIVVSLLAVLAVKYYTSVGMRKLDRRLGAVKRDLERSKQKREAAQHDQGEASREEAVHEERIRAMKDIIRDLEYRLTISREAARAVEAGDRE
jgi:hypothetical protein